MVTRERQKVAVPDILAVKGLGQFDDFPAVASLRRLIYPGLLSQLAEEFRHYSDIGGQVFISTHSPDFLDAIRLEELYCIVKVDGYTNIVRPFNLPLVVSQYHEGDLLGELWQQGILLSEAVKAGGSQT